MSTILHKRTYTTQQFIHDKYDDGSDEAQNVFDRLPVKMAFRHTLTLIEAQTST